jgi:hypothetical protein
MNCIDFEECCKVIMLKLAPAAPGRDCGLPNLEWRPCCLRTGASTPFATIYTWLVTTSGRSKNEFSQKYQSVKKRVQ